MEPKKFLRLKLKMLLFVVVTSIAVWCICLLFLQFVIAGLLDNGIRRLFYWLAQNWNGMTLSQAQSVYATYITANKPVILPLGLVVIVLINCYLSLDLFARYLNMISSAAHQLFGESETPIKLPAELAPIQADLNGIQRAIAAQRKLTQTSEQRKSDLIAYLAHDLKTPLTSVLGYLELLDAGTAGQIHRYRPGKDPEAGKAAGGILQYHPDGAVRPWQGADRGPVGSAALSADRGVLPPAGGKEAGM